MVQGSRFVGDPLGFLQDLSDIGKELLKLTKNTTQLRSWIQVKRAVAKIYNFRASLQAFRG